MNFVDTHTHLYDEAYNEDIGKTISRAIGSGVAKMILPDIDSKSREPMFSLAAQYPGILFPCLGLHPTEVNASWRDEIDLIMEHTGKTAVAAIGEIGMDLYWSKEFKAEQEEAFRVQVELAEKLDIPIIIHSREATEATLRILEDYRGRGLKGVFHAYSGSIGTFREIERLGDFYVGIGGVVTFRKASIAETIKDIPLERILTETDSPWLTPAPHRGTRNESSYIPLIAEKIASQKGIGIEEVAEATWDNAHKLFRI
ncbi:MAG: TatD family hydrolase [Bacteroidales bacterium]|nr:TatD family hydrolase [Bacteroides sp.]MCM1198860.1 TatD family hydrolase [Clostridium sp.]MCM1501706.1 TatD family hydrolase [Bacteroidales bacterium]